jgi:hypothetical protein
MPISWVIAVALIAFIAGWFFAGAFRFNRAEDIYREGYAKGFEDGTRADREAVPR